MAHSLLLTLFLASTAFATMQPGWNRCSFDLVRERWAEAFPPTVLPPEQMSYRWAGNPKGPVLVMLHGVDAASVTFDNVVPELGKKYRILLVDLRGHGKTPAVGTDYWPARMADDVIGLLKHLGVEHCHLLGHSMGGRIGMRVVERAPRGMVKSFVLEDMSLEAWRNLTPEGAARVLAHYQALYDAFKDMAYDRAELIEKLATLVHPKGRDPRAVAEDVVNRRARPAANGKFQLLYRPWVGFLLRALAAVDDARDVLRRVAIPVLDLRADPSAPDRSAEGPVIPPARLVEIPGAGHVIHRTRPEAFLREVLAFLDAAEQGQRMPQPSGKPRRVIAADGIEADEASRKFGILPRGSALLTSSGDLAATGIRSIVHAATGSSRRTGGKFDPTLASVQQSIRNSLALAREVSAQRVALPFIGGRIFLERIGTTAEALAEAIVSAALEARGNLELRFVLFSDAEAAMFQAILRRLGAPAEVRAATGNIVAFGDHGADVIVNAANTEVRFGDGVSGAIARASGHALAIDEEAKRAIAAYYAP